MTDEIKSGMLVVCPNCGHTFDRDAVNKVDAPLDSVAIKRIIEEVRNDNDDPPRGYNRTYHRHNR